MTNGLAETSNTTAQTLSHIADVPACVLVLLTTQPIQIFGCQLALVLNFGGATAKVQGKLRKQGKVRQVVTWEKSSHSQLKTGHKKQNNEKYILVSIGTFPAGGAKSAFHLWADLKKNGLDISPVVSDLGG